MLAICDHICKVRAKFAFFCELKKEMSITIAEIQEVDCKSKKRINNRCKVLGRLKII